MINTKRINQIINNWDPIELFNCHVPSDEYLSESKKITQYYETNTPNTYELANRIYSIFIESFGPEIFKCNIEKCIEIAKIILTDM